jgi:dolichyl-phosphate-mannose-protein mannosyltransferase
MNRMAASWASRPTRINCFDLASAALIAALVILTFLTFNDYAISNDEEVQHRYGELIIAYYRSGFADQTLFHFKNLYLYGGLFDTIAVLTSWVLPIDPYRIRHVLSALAGIGGILATWATARLVAGPRAGALAALALAVCGPWYGAMFNHTKDIPFAAAMTGATYFLLRASRDLPSPRQRHLLAFGILLGAALGLRAVALLLPGYVAMTILLQAWLQPGWHARASFARRSLLAFLPAFVLGYIIMLAAWPWAALDVLNPIRAIFAFAHFHYPIRDMAFGEIYEMADVPRWYVPLYFGIKLPLALLLGAVIATLFTVRSLAVRGHWSRDAQPREAALLAFVVVFPLLCQVIARGPAFTGMRHFTFMVPPLAALAGIGFDALLCVLEQRRRAFATVALAGLVIAFGWNAIMLVQLHPHQYLFYNPLVGGLEGASRRFSGDYWVNIMPEAVDELEAFLDHTEPNDQRRYTVGVCGERLPFEKEADRRLQWTPDWKRADFFIAPTHMNCDRVLKGHILMTIERLGVPIGVVKDLRGFSPEERRFAPEIAHSR